MIFNYLFILILKADCDLEINFDLEKHHYHEYFAVHTIKAWRGFGGAEGAEDQGLINKKN